MSLIISLIYGAAAVLSAYLLYRRIDVLIALTFFFCLLLILEENSYFFALMFPNTDQWPAVNFQQIMALAWKGVSTPTTIIELGLVGFGRLFAVMFVLYGGYFLFKYWDVVKTYVVNMHPTTLALVLLWEISLAVVFVISVLGMTSLLPLVAMLKVIGAVAALGLVVADLVRQQPQNITST